MHKPSHNKSILLQFIYIELPTNFVFITIKIALYKNESWILLKRVQRRFLNFEKNYNKIILKSTTILKMYNCKYIYTYYKYNNLLQLIGTYFLVI